MGEVKQAKSKSVLLPCPLYKLWPRFKVDLLTFKVDLLTSNDIIKNNLS